MFLNLFEFNTISVDFDFHRGAKKNKVKKKKTEKEIEGFAKRIWKV